MTETQRTTDTDDSTDRTERVRRYIKITPSTDSLSKSNIENQFRRLHELAQPDNSSWYRELLQVDTTATIECLLVSRGGSETDVEYYFTVDNCSLDTFERVLQSTFPDTFEFKQTPISIDEIADPDADRPASDVSFVHRDDRYVASVEYHARAERRKDWQVGLKEFETPAAPDEDERLTLAAVVETMAETSATVVYQALFQPLSDWTSLADKRRENLKRSDSPFLDRLLGPTTQDSDIFGSGHDRQMTEAASRRFDALDNRESNRSFLATVRAAAITPSAESEKARQAAEELASVFGPIGSKSYAVEGTVLADDADRFLSSVLQSYQLQYMTGSRVLDCIRNRAMHPSDYERAITLSPWVKNRSLGIVTDPREAPHFCLLGGSAMTTTGNRALDTTPGERTALPRPPDDRLNTYHKPGFAVGYPVTQDGEITRTPIAIPPKFQPRHLGIFAKSGAGKSTVLINAILDNHAATDGLDVLIDPKGGTVCQKYLLAHYLRYGDLDNVYYFDCSEMLPSFSFFDIRSTLDAGVSRTTAIEDITDHYIDILRQIMSGDNFDQAVRSPDVLRYLIKAQFDPVNGSDAFSHSDLHASVRRMHEHQTPPAVSDENLEELLGGVAADSTRSFDNIMKGVLTRIEKITSDNRLARIFDYSPDDPDEAFDFGEYLDEDAVIIFDTGSLRTETQRALTLVELSNLWTALKQRNRRSDIDTDHPLVNVYLEEASTIANSEMLGELLAEAREFDCSITLSAQFPSQFGQGNADSRDAREEVLNNISTLILGNVPIDERLARRLATDTLGPQEVGNRLRALESGQWMLNLPAPYHEPEPRPFLASSLSPPPGDPAGDRPATDAEQQTVENMVDNMTNRMLDDIGLTLQEPSVAENDAADEDDEEELPRVDSALPYTKRLPDCIQYDAAMHALVCDNCGNRYSPHAEGLRRAIDCCHDFDSIDRDDMPVCDLDLKLSYEERVAAAYSDRQLLFLQAVYDGQQLRYDPEIEYDITRDSMIRLQEYIGIADDAIQDLLETDLLRHDTDHPHRLYSVSADGRKLLGEGYRQGVDYGGGEGDLEESSQHVFAIEVARRYLAQEYVQNPDSSVVEAHHYHDIAEQRRLDLAGLDANGEVVVAVEAERINHDISKAVPSDFDKMADCNPKEAIWVVMTRSGGHQVLTALNDPPDGETRVEKTYSETTPPEQYAVDTPGLSDVYTVESLRDMLDRNG